MKIIVLSSKLHIWPFAETRSINISLKHEWTTT